MKVPLLDLKAQYDPIKGELTSAIRDVMEKSSFILGPFVEKLERDIAAYSGAKYGIGVASGTDALLLSLRASGIDTGDEVITSSYTFFATAGSISRLGAKPVFVDIDLKTYNILPSLIESKITKKTKAIIPVHLYGQCSDMNPILAIAAKHNLKVIEDAAQAIGAEYEGRKAGSMGDTGCLSFFPSKNLGGCGDGGMVLTNDDGIAEKIRVLRVHGSKPKYYHSIVGYNSRLDSLQAAILSVKFKYLDGWSEARRKNAQRYDNLFKGTGIVTPYITPANKSVYNQYVIRVEKRDDLQKFLKEKGVETALYYPLPLHLQKCYENLGYKEGDLPESEKAAKETIAIPVYPELTEGQQKYVVDSIKEFYGK